MPARRPAAARAAAAHPWRAASSRRRRRSARRRRRTCRSSRRRRTRAGRRAPARPGRRPTGRARSMSAPARLRARRDTAPGAAKPSPRSRGRRAGSDPQPTHRRARSRRLRTRLPAKCVKRRAGRGPPVGSACRGRLRPTAAPGRRLARHLPGAGVAQVGLLRAAARVVEVDAHHGALRLVDFVAAVVANEHGLSRQVFLLDQRWFDAILADKARWNYAAARPSLIRHERSRLRSACSSRSSPVSRAETTRKCRGRKSAIVRPSRYCSITGGLM